ncbi:MAG: methyltransferase type 12, partial [Candidatus Binataceae bacterium]
TLLKPGGFLAVMLRNGPSESGRGFYPVSRDELERLARAHGAFVELAAISPDMLGRSDISWTQILIRLPDDGTGALPLLRHIVLGDAKSSTYKLALLRTVALIADGAARMTQEVDDDHVAVPLGLIALFWIRLFKPLIKADLPQTPTNRGPDGLGFIREGFGALDSVSHLDLRVSARFRGANAAALHQALRDACDTVVRMPANYITYPNGGQILKAHRRGRIIQPLEILLDQEYLASFGELRIPTNIWRALERFDAWIEPALIAEWVRLMNAYAESQGRRLDERIIRSAMAWSDPTRDVALARQLAINLLRSGNNVYCVWPGKKLGEAGLDIDHCLPWSAWPCGDLWNLMPAQRMVSQRQKRERLPLAERLRQAQDLIEAWWNAGYYSSPNATISERFLSEARASLPSIVGTAQPSLDDIFSGVALQRLRLKLDQQVPEWT